MEMIKLFGNAALALGSVVGLSVVARTVYKQVTEGVAATLEKEHQERDLKNIKGNRDQYAKLTNG